MQSEQTDKTVDNNASDRSVCRFEAKTFLHVLLMLVLLVFSITGGFIYDPTSDVEELKEQQIKAASVTATAVSVSTAISLLPDDIGGTVADEIDDVTGYMIVATAYIMLERFIVVVAGKVAFWGLIPLSLVLFLLCGLRRSRKLRKIAARLLCLGLSLFLLIPGSLRVNRCFDIILETDTVFEALEQAKAETEPGTEERSLWAKVSGFVSDAVDRLKDVHGTIQRYLIVIMDSIAVMLITTLVVPILCILLLWLISKSVIKSILQILPQDMIDDAKDGAAFVRKTAKGAMPSVRRRLHNRSTNDCEK